MTPTRMAARRFIAGIAFAVASSTFVDSAAAQRPAGPLKVYISADMEGITGVASVDQLGPGSFEYERAREWMTGEVLAAIQGARDAGATEFVVSDSHGNGESLLIDRFPTDVPITIVRSFPRPLGMMEGIDSTFAAVIFIGYHASTSSTTGVRAHTISSALLTRIALNGISMSEAGINAAITAEYGVPVVMLTGDDAIVAETKERLGPIEGVAVERRDRVPLDRHDDPRGGAPADSSACRDRRQKARRNEALLGDAPDHARGVVQELPPGGAARLSVERAANQLAHHLQYVGRNMLDVSKFIEFVTSYEPTLSP